MAENETVNEQTVLTQMKQKNEMNVEWMKTIRAALTWEYACQSVSVLYIK